MNARAIASGAPGSATPRGRPRASDAPGARRAREAAARPQKCQPFDTIGERASRGLSSVHRLSEQGPEATNGSRAPAHSRRAVVSSPAQRPPVARLPRSVEQCHNRGGRTLALYTWPKNDPSRLRRAPFRCGSWRCAGECARCNAARLFARLTEAAARPEFAPTGWVFLVLTLDRDGYHSGEARWRDANAAFRALSKMLRNFLTSLRRWCARNGWTSPGSNWAAVVEVHKSGVPHLNLVLYCSELAEHLEQHRRAVRDAGARVLWKRRRSERRHLHSIALPGERLRAELARVRRGLRRDARGVVRSSKLAAGDLLSLLQRAGFGAQCTAERARSRGAIAGYFVKIAGKHDTTVGEVAKLTQLPLNAPHRFRRLRSGKGFLPKQRKNEEVTGTMVRREHDPQRSAFGAVPLYNIKRPEVRAVAIECCRLEGERVEREHLARSIGKAIGVSPSVLVPDVEHFASGRLVVAREHDGAPSWLGIVRAGSRAVAERASKQTARSVR